MKFKEDFNFFKAFTQNGWQWHPEEERNTLCYGTYTMVVMSEYDCRLYARVGEWESDLQLSGEYGVHWIDVEYEKDAIEAPYDWECLENLRDAIIMAEKNLTTLGIPFVNSYEFHADNKLELYHKNQDTRQKFGIDEKEIHDNEERHKRNMEEIEKKKLEKEKENTEK